MGRIFLGSGESSKEAVQELHRKLDAALEILSGLQQPMDPTVYRSKEQQKTEDVHMRKMDLELEEIAEEIFYSLTGKVLSDFTPRYR